MYLSSWISVFQRTGLSILAVFVVVAFLGATWLRTLFAMTARMVGLGWILDLGRVIIFIGRISIGFIIIEILGFGPPISCVATCKSRRRRPRYHISWDYNCDISVRLWPWAEDPIPPLVAVTVKWVSGVNGTWIRDHVIRDRGASACDGQGVG